MSSEARTIMKELREDHRNMSIVLSLLEDAAEEASRETTRTSNWSRRSCGI